MQHSILSPSKAHIWTRCTCYRSETRISPAGAAGTEAHAMAERALKNGEMPEYPIAGYVNYVQSLKGEKYIETEVNLRWLCPSSKIDLGIGHCDAFVWNGLVLEVIDLKTGKIPVSPIENLQLAIYAYCIVKELDLKPIEFIRMTIFQFDNATSWELTWPALQSFIEERVEKGVLMVLSGAEVRKTGDYCQWSQDKRNCSAFLKEDEIGMTPAEIVKRAKAWESLANDIKSEIRTGALIDSAFDLRITTRYYWKKDAVIPDEVLELMPPTANAKLYKQYPELIGKVESQQVWCKNDI